MKEYLFTGRTVLLFFPVATLACTELTQMNMKKTKKKVSGIMNKERVAALMKRTEKTHSVWHKFCDFLSGKLGLDWRDKLVGYEVMELIESYAKRHRSIKLSYCDDDHFCSSMIVIVPHKGMGNTVLFIPQCCNITNTFFLYPGHQKMLIEQLNKVTHPCPLLRYYSKQRADQ